MSTHRLYFYLGLLILLVGVTRCGGGGKGILGIGGGGGGGGGGSDSVTLTFSGITGGEAGALEGDSDDHVIENLDGDQIAVKSVTVNPDGSIEVVLEKANLKVGVYVLKIREGKIFLAAIKEIKDQTVTVGNASDATVKTALALNLAKEYSLTAENVETLYSAIDINNQQIVKIKAIQAAMMASLTESDAVVGGRVKALLDAINEGNLDFLDSLSTAKRDALISTMGAAMGGTPANKEQLLSSLNGLLAQIKSIQDTLANAQNLSPRAPLDSGRPRTISALPRECSNTFTLGANLSMLCIDRQNKVYAVRINPGGAFIKLLTEQGTTNPISAEGFVGATTYFGPVTRAAVAKFQGNVLNLLEINTQTGNTESTSVGANGVDVVALGRTENDRPKVYRLRMESGVNNDTVKPGEIRIGKKTGSNYSTADFSSVTLYDGSTRHVSRLLNTTGTTNDLEFTKLNLFVPAGATKTFYVVGTLYSANPADNNKEVVIAEVEEQQGQGNSVTLKRLSLTIVKSPSPVADVVVSGNKDFQFATFKIKAGAGEDVTVQSIPLKRMGMDSNNDIRNVHLYYDENTKIAGPDDVVKIGEGAVYNFSTSFNVNKNQTKTLIIKGDLSRDTDGDGNIDSFKIDFGDRDGDSQPDFDITLTADESTNSTTISAGSLTAASDPRPVAQMVAGVKNIKLMAFTFSAETQFITIRNLVLGHSLVGALMKSANIHLKLLDQNGNVIGQAQVKSEENDPRDAVAEFDLGWSVPKGETKAIELKADVFEVDYKIPNSDGSRTPVMEKDSLELRFKNIESIDSDINNLIDSLKVEVTGTDTKLVKFQSSAASPVSALMSETAATSEEDDVAVGGVSAIHGVYKFVVKAKLFSDDAEISDSDTPTYVAGNFASSSNLLASSFRWFDPADSSHVPGNSVTSTLGSLSDYIASTSSLDIDKIAPIKLALKFDDRDNSIRVMVDPLTVSIAQRKGLTVEVQGLNGLTQISALPLGSTTYQITSVTFRSNPSPLEADYSLTGVGNNSTFTNNYLITFNAPVVITITNPATGKKWKKVFSRTFTVPFHKMIDYISF